MDPRGYSIDAKIKQIDVMFASLNKLKNRYVNEKRAETRATSEFRALMNRLAKV